MPPALASAIVVVRVLIALLFIGMGIVHFIPAVTHGMAAMIPPRLRRSRVATPLRLVWFTGICEIAGGVGMLIPATRFAAALALSVFLVAVFPANAYAAEHRDRFGRVAIPFWPRLIAQLALIVLVVVVGVTSVPA
ncbi:DoxX family protein [Galbitalea soli]|uniref:DoxX family membrane protein n=1 Tax=Galbitalea soli TaxID=1268042 RepID=A0A7C9PN44_9MICO|nr:DoxX family protein [Galbitalea soli]NEM91453.1 hypothetical protein [Galbitalea soli]NYJ30146.1 putative membrane protein [Galbitalea soli]